MILKLEIRRASASFVEVDLFADSELEYNVDFYDTLDVSKIRLPFSSDIKLPMTDLNMSQSRFNYNPNTNTQDLFPKDNFFFKITIAGSANTIIEGILTVKSFEYISEEPYIDVNLNDYVSKYISDLKDTTIAEVYDADTTSYGAYFRANHSFLRFFQPASASTNPGEAGVLNQNPTDRPIIFPFIDFCNDIKGKFGYAERQFTEYGVGMDRAGIVPAFSVKNFLTTLGYWLTSQGFNTRVDSKLFGLNHSEAIPDFEAEKLHMLMPCKLEADVDTNTREFTLKQAPFWTGTNRSLISDTDDDGADKLFISNYFWNMATFGNFGPFNANPENPDNPFPITTVDDFGLDVTNNAYPTQDTSFGSERGYFAPHMSYSADILYRSGKTFADVPIINYEIPVLGEDGMVYQILPQDAQSTMTFGVFIGVYENGEMVKKIRLQDAAGPSGNPVVLDISDATAVAGLSNKTVHTGSSTHNYYSNSNYSFSVPFGIFRFTFSNYVIFDTSIIGSDVRDMLSWDLNDLGVDLYLPEETMDISGESRYGVNYFIEPIDGDIKASVSTSRALKLSNRYEINAVTDTVYGTDGIEKAITRADNYGELNLKFVANANFNPYFINRSGTADVYNIKESLENTATMTPYEVLVAICKRFNCGIYYEKAGSQNILRVDPLHLVRAGSQSINDLVDDLKSVKVYLGGDKIKNLTIKNKDYGLYYDDENDDGVTIGSTTQEINTDGVSDLVIDLKSAIYYNSVAGDFLINNENENLELGIISSSEMALTPNLFTKHQDIGLRFAYVDKPLYNTWIKKPFVVNDKSRPAIKTVTQRIYKNFAGMPFNGRLFHYNTQGWNLLAENESGSTTDYYSFFSDNEKIKYSNSPTIEFDMVVPTSNLSSLDFFFKTLNASRINQSDILVKSAKGEVLGDYAYLTITGLLQ